uniref:Uncharacterized protein n=1 Tax=Manihot esculenta TaxID=3983 RepID=A0A2C9VAH0_MANES
MSCHCDSSRPFESMMTFKAKRKSSFHGFEVGQTILWVVTFS